jgi:hypothetical protein
MNNGWGSGISIMIHFKFNTQRFHNYFENKEIVNLKVIL